MDRYVFSVIVDGLDPRGRKLVEAFDGFLEVLLLSDVDGVVTIDVEIEATSPDAAVRTATHLLESGLPGVSVTGIDFDLVAATDIADRVGVSRQSVTNWATGKRSGAPFPPPLGRVAGGTRIWAWSTVLPWLQQHGHAEVDEQTLPYSSIVEANALLRSPRQADHFAVTG